MRTMGKAMVVVLVAGLALATARWGAGRAEAQGGAPGAEPARVAVLDVLMVVEKMMESDRYRPQREAFRDEQKAKLEALQGEISKIEDKGRAMKQDDPELPALAQEYQAKKGDAQQLFASVETYAAKQFVEAYRLALESGNAVAERHGYSHVVMTQLDRPIPEVGSVGDAIQAIMLRTMVRYPKGDDLTPLVMKELAVDKPAAEPSTTPPAPGTPSPADWKK